MNKLEIFIKNLCGEFNNDNQLKKEFESGKVVHPKARHINNVCNHKIKNLPENFEGYFVIEESYYEQGKFKNVLPHLFLFTLNKDNNVVLTSYDLPENIPTSSPHWNSILPRWKNVISIFRKNMQK